MYMYIALLNLVCKLQVMKAVNVKFVQIFVKRSSISGHSWEGAELITPPTLLSSMN